eukprot:jgi/Ulvmu1/7667/UM038_0096.1
MDAEQTGASDASELRCAPSYAPVAQLDNPSCEHIPPLDTVLAEGSFHTLAEGSNGYYGTRPDPEQQPTVVGGLIHSRHREELLRILELPATDRSPEQVKNVVDLMARTAFAEGLQVGLLAAVAPHVRLVWCAKGATIIRERDPGDFMYIIVSGECQLEKADRRGKRRVLRTMETGQAFGELALQVAGGRRAATIKAKADVELLTINGFKYREVLVEHHQRDIAQRVELLWRLPVFKGISMTLLREIAQIMERRVYQVGGLLFQQGDEADAMFVLTTGSVRVVREMTVTPQFAAAHRLDPVTLHLLDPSHEQQDRFQPLPERAIRNGRPRSIYVHAGRMTARPHSPNHPGPRRPQSAASAGNAAAAAPRRRPVSATQRAVGDRTSDAVRRHLQGRLHQSTDRGGAAAAGTVVPGFEMSGITAQDLQGAGILYTAEAPLLHGKPKVAAPVMPPSPRPTRRGGRTATQEPQMCKAWVELSTLEAPDYLGEAAVLRRGVRHATAIAMSSVEVLVLAKLDFDLKVDADTRDVVGVLVAQYPKDPELLRSMQKEAQWETYKRDVVQEVLLTAQKPDRLQHYSSYLFPKAWRP